MKKFVLALLLAACSTAHSAPTTPAPAPKPTSPPAAKAGDPPPLPLGSDATCPVSGEKFKVKEKTVQVVYNGKRYAFCCPECIGDFNKNPAKYAK
jgi:YHS domain-containing protein